MKERTATFHITAVLGRSTRDAYALRLTLPRVCTRQRSALLPLVVLSRSRLYIHFPRYRCTGCAFSLSLSHRKVEARSRGSNALTRVHRCMHTFFSRMHIRLSACLFFLSLSPSLFLFSHALRCTSYLSLSADSIQPAGVCLSGVCQQGGEEHERKNGTVVEERVRYLYAYKNTTSSTMTNYAENQSTTTTVPAPTMRTSQTFARSHHHSF